MHADAPFPDPGTCPFALRVFPARLRPWERGKRGLLLSHGWTNAWEKRLDGRYFITMDRWKIDFLIIARVAIKNDWSIIVRESSEVYFPFRKIILFFFNDYSFGEKDKNFCPHHRLVSRYLNYEFLTADSWQSRATRRWSLSSQTRWRQPWKAVAWKTVTCSGQTTAHL